MTRGELYWAREPGKLTDKPRPVLVVQNDVANGVHTTITVCLVSSVRSGHDLFRVAVLPSPENGLDRASEVQVDRLYSFLTASLTHRFGRLSVAHLAQVDTALRRWLDL